MNKKPINSLLEAKRQIDDTITQLIRENETEGKGIWKITRSLKSGLFTRNIYRIPV